MSTIRKAALASTLGIALVLGMGSCGEDTKAIDAQKALEQEKVQKEMDALDSESKTLDQELDSLDQEIEKLMNDI
jgi:peptidoglycan hydrolase CwlO-like protein